MNTTDKQKTVKQKIALGIDIGGTGIKGAPVDTKKGEFLAERYRIPTPQPATPKAVGKAVARVIAEFDLPEDVPVGVAFPGVVQGGKVKATTNMDQEWVGLSVTKVIKEYSGRKAVVVNDADAAGFGEYKFGAAHGQKGNVLMVTLGTGVGTALVADGTLVPNLELGNISIDGEFWEAYAADSARTKLGLSWEDWADNLQKFFAEMERLLWPDLIIVGGGVSKSSHMFLPLLKLRAPIVPAELLNGAGIIGAAALAAKAHKAKK